MKVVMLENIQSSLCMKKVIDILIKRNETISTMESCTGGGVANYITNFPNSSKILKFSAVTYSNEYKIKMGVSEDVIKKHSVYSMETAHEMAKNISSFANSTYGIGVTGKLKRIDESNLHGDDSEVFISIYNNGNYYDQKIIVDKDTREENKKMVIDVIINMMEMIINEKNK